MLSDNWDGGEFDARMEGKEKGQGRIDLISEAF